jgi:hypothetical protein
MRRLMFMLCSALLFAGVANSQDVPGQEKKAIKPIARWTGFLLVDQKTAGKDDPTPADAPKSGYLTKQDDLEKLWNKWSVKGKLAKIDFTKQIVFVQLASGPNTITTAYLLDKDGDLTAKSQQTLKAGPGFGFGIDVLNRQGIKSYKGQPIE